ncbi:hypothetical protein ACGFNP_30715 [Nonomuraea sp. NPDC049269]|uniref:hypothetical protein n=1 Tax=Nonomuraea sp. NPDC049269 TaxID=3364349 RepID=UPI00371A8387
MIGAGTASSDCKGQVTLRLQRKRWYGWETVANDTWDTKYGRSAVVEKGCAGTNYTWRVWMYSDSAGGATAANVKISC